MHCKFENQLRERFIITDTMNLFNKKIQNAYRALGDLINDKRNTI